MSEYVLLTNVSPLSGKKILVKAGFDPDNMDIFVGKNISDIGSGYSNLGELLMNSGANSVTCVDPCYESLGLQIIHISESLANVLKMEEIINMKKLTLPIIERKEHGIYEDCLKEVNEDLENNKERFTNLLSFLLYLLTISGLEAEIKAEIFKFIKMISYIENLVMMHRLNDVELNMNQNGIKYLKKESSNTGIEGNSQDFVFMTCLITHLDNPIPTLIEADRILKPGGEIIITDYYGNEGNKIHIILEKLGGNFQKIPIDMFTTRLKKGDIHNIITATNISETKVIDPIFGDTTSIVNELSQGGTLIKRPSGLILVA